MSLKHILASLLLCALAGFCSAEYAFSPSASLEHSWRIEFDAVKGGSLRRPVPATLPSRSIMLDGLERHHLVGGINGREVTTRGDDLTAWSKVADSQLRYLELDDYPVRELDALPDSVLKGVTHLNLLPSGTTTTPEDLAFAQDHLPSLTALGLSLSRTGVAGQPRPNLQQVVDQLRQFPNLSELALHIHDDVPVHLVHAVCKWTASLKHLKRLHLNISPATNWWSDDFAARVSGLEWLYIWEIPLESIASVWEAILRADGLRCLGLGEQVECGWSAERVASLASLAKLEALSLAGGYTGEGNDLCQALEKLKGLRHLNMPDLPLDEKWYFPVPAQLTELRSLRLKVLNSFSLKWIASQSNLVELWASIIGYPTNPLSGTLAGLQACKSLRKLFLGIHDLPEEACEGLRSLPLTTLTLEGGLTEAQQPALARLITACGKTTQLFLDIGVADKAPSSLSAEVSSSIATLKSLTFLAMRLPDQEQTKALLASLEELEVLFSLGIEYPKNLPALVKSTPTLRVLVFPGLPDELAVKINDLSPDLLVLRDFFG